MTIVYTLLEVAALLAVIIVPLKPQVKKKAIPKNSAHRELGGLAVNEEGYLEYYSPTPGDNHPVNGGY